MRNVLGLGTTGLLMVALAGVAGGLAGCQTSTTTSGPRDQTTISDTGTTGQVEGRPTFQMPIAIPGAEAVMVPFALQSNKGLFEDEDPYSAGGVRGIAPRSVAYSKSYESYMPPGGQSGEVRWHNVIFRDLRLDEEWALLQKRGIIGQWQMFGRVMEKDGPWKCRGIVFIAVLEDTNRDGSLDNRDARVAILTKGDGRDPHVISPADAQVWSMGWNESTETLHLMVAKDTSGDGKFDFSDVAVPYTAWIGSDEPATPTASPAMQERVRGLLK